MHIWEKRFRVKISILCNQLLFADDTALMADSEEKLCRLVSEFRRVIVRRKLRVNVGKSKLRGARALK